MAEPENGQLLLEDVQAATLQVLLSELVDLLNSEQALYDWLLAKWVEEEREPRQSILERYVDECRARLDVQEAMLQRLGDILEGKEGVCCRS